MSTTHLLKSGYRIVREIGRGGIGVVYEAHDEKTNKRVALKELFRRDAEAYKLAVKRSLLARLKDPSLPKVMRPFQEDGSLYLVMDYIEGDNFAELLAKQKGPFPREQVLQWADQLLELLIYLHGRAVFNSDIKPANLKLKQGRIVLLDFGLAEGGVGQSTDPRVDLYALSATLYHLLTNKLPEDALRRKQASELGLPDPLKPANHLNPDVPSALADVIAQGMALYPDKRPASAKDMQALLKEAKEGQAKKLKLFRQALASKDDKRIVAAYEAHFDPELTPSEREQWQETSQAMGLLEGIDEAIGQGDERALLKISAQMMEIRPVTSLSEAQSAHIREARLRQAAFARFEEALKSEDEVTSLLPSDARIIASYDAQWLEGYQGVSRKQMRRLERAKKRQAALREFREACKGQDEDGIVQAYQPQWLDGYVELLPSERQELSRVRRYLAMREDVRKAIQKDDDSEILQAIDQSLVRSWSGLTEVELERLNLAQQRGQKKLKRFRQALWSQDDKRIVETYEADFYPELTPSERKQWQEASQVMRVLAWMDDAIRKGDERAILSLYRQMPIRPFTTFSEGQRAHIRETRLRQAALERFEEALESQNDTKIIASYDYPWLESYQGVSQKQIERLELAQKRQAALEEFREALLSQEEANDARTEKQRIMQAYQPQWLDGYVELLPSEREELLRVRRYLAMRERVREAIHKDDDSEILEAINQSLVRSWRGLTEAELARLKLAQQRQVALYFFKKSLESEDKQHIISSYNPNLDESNLLEQKDRQQLQQARKQRDTLREFREVLWGKDSQAREIVNFYERLSHEDKKKLLPAEQERVAVAKKQSSAQTKKASRSRRRHKTRARAGHHNRAKES
jgi:serine/threonine-protein kinase